MKHATKNLDDVSYTFVHAGRDFGVYCGAETMTYPMLALGGSGHVSATGVVAPKEIAELYNLAAAGRWDEARDLHYRMLELNDILFIEVNPVPPQNRPVDDGPLRGAVAAPAGSDDAGK